MTSTGKIAFIAATAGATALPFLTAGSIHSYIAEPCALEQYQEDTLIAYLYLSLGATVTHLLAGLAIYTEQLNGVSEGALRITRIVLHLLSAVLLLVTGSLAAVFAARVPDACDQGAVRALFGINAALGLVAGLASAAMGLVLPNLLSGDVNIGRSWANVQTRRPRFP